MTTNKSPREALEEIDAILSKFFKSKRHKYLLWLTIPNPLLDFVAPCDMIKAGREKKLLKAMKAMVDESLLE